MDISRRQFLKYAIVATVMPKSVYAREDRQSMLEGLIDSKYISSIIYGASLDRYFEDKITLTRERRGITEEYGNMVLFKKKNYRLMTGAMKRQMIAKMPDDELLAYVEMQIAHVRKNSAAIDYGLVQERPFGAGGKSKLYVFEPAFGDKTFYLEVGDKRSHMAIKEKSSLMSGIANMSQIAQQYSDGIPGLGIGSSNYLDIHQNVFHFTKELQASAEEVASYPDLTDEIFDAAEEHLYQISKMVTHIDSFAALMGFTTLNLIDRTVMARLLDDIREKAPSFLVDNRGRTAYGTLVRAMQDDKSGGV
jgi:hypothetical protein